MDRFVCVHGHFYQPPRENPWLGVIELQDSAAPFHDWNERITSECYAPNAVARILDGDTRIVELVNNYARISFNFGPTLLSWMEQTHPDLYRLILEGDEVSRERFSGHGSALAQVYNHIIMPLANRRDKVTQIRWGIRDFEHRFRRRPEGMWLAETAVDLETLDVLAEHGIRFTILSPYQAGQVRWPSSPEWMDATGGRIDTKVPYRQRLPSGREIALFFYDAPVSQGVAFERLLDRGEKLAERLLGRFDDRTSPQLVHIATDGETYGHHHRHGDMALAYALHHIEKRPDVRLTNYGEFLERFPPVAEVKIVERTAWSCSHGIGRWEDDCGCSTGRGWHQRWRRPLRQALDVLRDQLEGPTEELGTSLVRDVWAARDDYIECVLDPAQRERFVNDHAVRELTDEDIGRLWRLMEYQHHAMLMYTSCGWFFDEISGIETVQILAYAGRVIQLAEELFDLDVESPFLEVLSQAPSNLPEHENGQRIYEKWVRPNQIDWSKIAAHYAVSSLFEDYAVHTVMFGYRLDREVYHPFEAGRVRMVLGRARLEDALTGEITAFAFGAIHFGDHNVNCGVTRDLGPEWFSHLLRDASLAFERVDYPAIIRLMDAELGESTYSLASLFRDERRRVLKWVLRENLADMEDAYLRLYQQHLPLMRFLAHANTPLPRGYRMAAEFVFNNELRRICSSDQPEIERVRELIRDAAEWDIAFEAEEHAFKFSRMLIRLANWWQEAPLEIDRLRTLREAVEEALLLPFEVNLWDVQNRFFASRRERYMEMDQPGTLAGAGGYGRAGVIEWLTEFAELGERLGIEVTQMRDSIRDYEAAPELIDEIRQLIANRHIPIATYRLQFHAGFTFDDAVKIVPYLAKLGVSDVYASPILKARPGSPHGYDICDHSQINPELGGREAFDRFSDALTEAGLRLILDTVPNHMGIDDSANAWWLDVLENGVSARHAQYFDIDWDPVNPDLRGKVLLPVLGEQYGLALEDGKFRLEYAEGGFQLTYYDHLFPIAPGTNIQILELALEQASGLLGETHEHVLELRSIITALSYLPPRTGLSEEKVAERYREKEIVRRRIDELLGVSPEIHDAINRSVTQFNGRVGEPESFDLLDQLIDAQSYRPAFWRVATEEINYRRFFDINDLAAIRVELPEVFKGTHELFMGLIREGKAHGLRIDHPDGLWRPTDYFAQLQSESAHALLVDEMPGRDPDQLRRELSAILAEEREPNGQPAWGVYVVAEKILSEDEPLPASWAVAGTSGYDFLNQLNSLFVVREHRDAFDAIYREFAGGPTDFDELVANCKKMIMLISMASEINSLSHQLDRITERNRQYRDFTLNSLTFVVREVIAYLPVYRTYLSSPDDVTLPDRLLIERTVRKAKAKNPRTYHAVFDFLADTLLLRNLDRFSNRDRPMLIDWVMRFQQVSGPVMAKGVEDTAFYQYNRLVSLNEVGGHPQTFGSTLEHFHRANMDRLASWPHSMLGTSTHDTKRSEDVRARLNILSEMPDEWQSALFAWSSTNSSKWTSIDDQLAPAFNDQYLFYQTLVGAWPTGPLTNEDYVEFRRRVAEYMQKATKEAKARTSWVNPVAEYDQAMSDFVVAVLPDDRENDPFLGLFLPFQEKIAYLGCFNSLSQVVLKAMSPGVPDCYQGNETWDHSLVDPDNRRPVDYDVRASALARLRKLDDASPEVLVERCAVMLADLPEGDAKLYVTHQCLQLRQRLPELFRSGTYEAAWATDVYRDRVCAFVRSEGERSLIVAVPLRVVSLTGSELKPPIGPEVWGEGQLELPADCVGKTYRNLFTGETFDVGEEGKVPLAAVFASFPVALFIHSADSDSDSDDKVTSEGDKVTSEGDKVTR